jgi:hypothetical protein
MYYFCHEMEHSSNEFRNLLKLRNKLVKLFKNMMTVMIYRTCLAENVTAKVLHLSKEP